MRHHNGGRQPNYDPNSFSERPNQSDELLYAPLEVHGRADIHAWTRHRADTDFVQASDLHRPMDEAARGRLIGNLADGLGAVTRRDIVEHSIGHFRHAYPDFGARLHMAVAKHQLDRKDSSP